MSLEKPDAFPDWAEQDVLDPVSGQTNALQPPSALKDFGWTFQQIPPRQWFNWWMRYVGFWIRWLDKSVLQSVVIDENYTATRSQLKILADTSDGSFDVTLPPSPSVGDEIEIFDTANTFFDRPVTVLRNGKLIQGEAEDIIVDEPHLKLLFVSEAIGWRVF